GAAEHRAQVGAAEGKIHRLFRPANDAQPLAVWSKHPDAARPGAIDAADAVDLQAVRYARLAAFVHVGKDATPDRPAVGIEPDGVNVFRRARVGDVHRALVDRQREPVRVFAMGEDADPAIGRDAIDARAVPQIVVARRSGNLALVIGAALVRIGEIKRAVGV